MEAHHLRVFVSVFKNRSFTAASRELHLSQPTVSEHVRVLEEELGTRLFDRAGRRVIPTREADHIYSLAIDILQRMDDLRQALGRFKGEIKGTLKIGASTIPGTYLIPPLAAGFKARYPETSFQVVVNDSRTIAEMVAGHELLLGVIGTRIERGGLQYAPFMDDELVLAARPGLLGKRSVTPARLGEIPFLIREEGSGTRKTAEARLREKGVDPADLDVVAVLGSTASVKEAVRAGLGASIISRLAVKEEIEAGTIQEIRIRGISMKRTLYIITHRRRTLPRHYAAFLDYLRDSAPSAA
jgi:DNA-binding transcriptional LysR family regulator